MRFARHRLPLRIFALCVAAGCAPAALAPPANGPSAPTEARSAEITDPTAASAPTAEAASTPTSRPAPIPPNTAVLLIGDSFALAGFTKALKPRMKELGARFDVHAETSSFTTT